MRVPDPEDSKYWYRSMDAKGPCLKFDLYQYTKDFRKWKDELRQVIQEFPWKGIPARGVPIEEIQEQFEKIGDWFKKIREILGEEASEKDV